MKQVCPKCCKWYDIYANVCPKCNVLMYPEKKAIKSVESGHDLKIISVDFINALNNWGWILLVVGTVGTISSIGFASFAKTIFGTFIALSFWILTTIVGVTLLLKSCHLRKGKKLREPRNHSYIKCPYCNSRKVVKLTTFDRASSIILVGAASGKLGKQWHCHNCDSNF